MDRLKPIKKKTPHEDHAPPSFQDTPPETLENQKTLDSRLQLARSKTKILGSPHSLGAREQKRHGILGPNEEPFQVEGVRGGVDSKACPRWSVGHGWGD